MTKMAVMPTYGKTLLNLLHWNKGADFDETWYYASRNQAIKWITWIDLFCDNIKFYNFFVAFILENVTMVDSSEIIAFFDLVN